MNDLSPPSLDPAQGADVLATIRRLLAQDATSPDDAATREGALRRRLIGTRRRGGMARPPAEAVLPLDETDAFAALPLRLADDQRIALPVAGEAGPELDEDMIPTAEAPAEASFSLVAAAMPALSTEAIDPEPLPLSMPSVPEVAVPGIAPPLSDAGPFLHDVPASGDTASGAWLFAAAQPADRLHELLTFQAWIAEPDSEAEAAESVTRSAQPITEPEPQAAVEAETLAQAPELPAQDPAVLAALIRETLLQELAGETGAQLGAAIRQLARDAIARALTDLARGLTVPEASGHQADG